MRNAQRFLFVSKWALCTDLAMRILQEGHEVKVWVAKDTYKTVGDGFVDKVDDWEEWADWADMVIFDDTGFGKQADELKARGVAVVGGSEYADHLEMDREFAKEEMAAAGMTILPSWTFQDFDECIAFVRENPGRYAVKPNGKAQEDKVLSYVGVEEDGKDLITVLEFYGRKMGGKIESVQLQTFVAGVEVGVGAYFNGTDFIWPASINFENKKLFPGPGAGIGPSTGEMGTHAFWASSGRLIEETLVKFLPRLREGGYVGCFDINCIVNETGIYPLEPTPRFGYPATAMEVAGMESPLGEFFAALALGQAYDLQVKPGFQVVVVMAVPPFPFTDDKAFEKYSEDMPVIFREPPDDGFHPGEVRIEGKDWVLAGKSGYALTCTGTGLTMEEARSDVYRRMRSVILPNCFYREDIGCRWREDSDLLRTWGYL